MRDHFVFQSSHQQQGVGMAELEEYIMEGGDVNELQQIVQSIPENMNSNEPSEYLEAFTKEYEKKGAEISAKPSEIKGDRRYSVVFSVQDKEKHLLEPILQFMYERSKSDSTEPTKETDTEHIETTKYTFWTDNASHAQKVARAFNKVTNLDAFLFDHLDTAQALLGYETEEWDPSFTSDPKASSNRKWEDVNAMKRTTRDFTMVKPLSKLPRSKK